MIRPYEHTQNFGTKYYEDEDRVNTIRTKMKRGVSKKEIRYQLEESALDSDTIDAVLNRVEEENSMQTFWEKNEKGTIKIVHILFKQFLEDNGFYKYCPEGGRNYIFVKVTNNLIDHTSEKEIKDFILSHLIELDDISVYNYFADNVRFFREEFLSLLSTIDIYFIEDSKDASYLYYRNCAVKITRDAVETIRTISTLVDTFGKTTSSTASSWSVNTKGASTVSSSHASVATTICVSQRWSPRLDSSCMGTRTCRTARLSSSTMRSSATTLKGERARACS